MLGILRLGKRSTRLRRKRGLPRTNTRSLGYSPDLPNSMSAITQVAFGNMTETGSCRSSNWQLRNAAHGWPINMKLSGSVHECTRFRLYASVVFEPDFERCCWCLLRKKLSCTSTSAHVGVVYKSSRREGSRRNAHS